MCFLFILEICGNAPLEKKNDHQKAQESRAAWSTDRARSPQTICISNTAVSPAPGSQPRLSVQRLRQVDIIAVYSKAQQNCIPWDLGDIVLRGQTCPLYPHARGIYSLF